MPVTPDLLNQINDAQTKGYSPDDIIASVSANPKYTDVATQLNDAKQKGYNSTDILQSIKSSPSLAPTDVEGGPLGSLVAGLSGLTKDKVKSFLYGIGDQFQNKMENVKSQMQPGFQETPEQTQQSYQNMKDMVAGVAGGAGAGSPNLTVPGYAPTGVKDFFLNSIPKKLYESVAKWSTALDPGTTLEPGVRQEMTNTALTEKLPFSQEGYDQLVSKARGYDADIKNMVANTPNVLIPRNSLYGNVVQAIDNQTGKVGDEALKKEMLDKFNNMVSTTSTLRNPLMTVEDAQALKQSLNQKLDQYFSQINKVGSSNTPDAEVGVWNAVRSALKQQIEKAVPGVSEVNAKEGDLLQLQPYFAKGINRVSNANAVGLGDFLTSGLGAGISTAAGAGPTIGAVTGYAAKKLLASPEMMSQYAIALKGLEKAGIPNAAQISQQSAIQLFKMLSDQNSSKHQVSNAVMNSKFKGNQ